MQIYRATRYVRVPRRDTAEPCTIRADFKYLHGKLYCRVQCYCALCMQLIWYSCYCRSDPRIRIATGDILGDDVARKDPKIEMRQSPQLDLLPSLFTDLWTLSPCSDDSNSSSAVCILSSGP